ncbi:conserved hypothetical protein [Vibrio chagasii]|nr:flagellar biosynthetic protein FliQ [Vibrio alginolyticus]CAH7154645.1 conserved hypothetical protein [Vibrio chagasii]CAH7324782.1 conserved hypothetical protein [Vibrio chagasii]
MEAQIMDMVKQGFMLAGNIVGFIVVPILLVGLVVAVFQAATNVNEASLGFVPKLMIIFGIVVYKGDSLLDSITQYFRAAFEMLATVGM